MTALMKYDQARAALAEAKSLREVKVITDKTGRYSLNSTRARGK